jgi:5'-nucleotidase
LGAAIEGALQGLPAIAFSSYSKHEPFFERCAPCAARILATYLSQVVPPHVALNVNFPSPAFSAIKGVRTTWQGMTSMADVATVVHERDGKMTLSLDGDFQQFSEHEESDVVWLEKGYATVTPIFLSSQINTHEVFSLLQMVFAPLATL